MRFCVVVFICSFLSACASSPPARVIERTPGTPAGTPTPTQVPAATQPITPGTGEKDWRPQTHIVKKGDTLHSIGLEYGHDYKEVAQKNNIPPPYVIHIGQQLQLPVETDPATPEEKGAADNGVVITPLKTEGGTIEPVISGTSPPKGAPIVGGPPLITGPKALREPYSEQALLAPPKVAKPVEVVKPTESKPGEDAKPQEAPGSAATTAAATDWIWPTNGKVVSMSAKGVDIAGTQGQAVNAAAGGKVIYSGSDLRGYGKLVIIKHDKNHLSVYAHNSQILVKEGQQVTKGQKIAEMGSTDSDKVKLHFEIRQQGKSVDPAKYLPAK